MSAHPDERLIRGFEAARSSLTAAVEALDAARGKAVDGRYGDAVLAIGQTMLARLQDADSGLNQVVDRLEALGEVTRHPL